MKRTATLLAGLLLVTGTVFAEGSTLDFSGTTIKAKSVLLNTAGANVNDDSNGDTDLVLNSEYMFSYNIFKSSSELSKCLSIFCLSSISYLVLVEYGKSSIRLVYSFNVFG